MKKVILLFLLLGASALFADTKKVVYDLTTGNIADFKQKILSGIVNTKTYYENKFDELEVAVIIHGKAYQFFLKDITKTEYKTNKALLKDHSDLQKRIASLWSTYDVKFYMCGVGMKKHKLDKTNVYDFVEVVPNATIGLVDQQNQGFAYLPVH